MNINFFSIILVLFFSALTKAELPKKQWAWNIDDTTYQIDFSEKNISYLEEHSRIEVKKTDCNKIILADFEKNFQKQVESYSHKVQFPKNYVPIHLSSIQIGKFAVAKGSELGLFLIDMKYEMTQLKGKSELVCQ